jgi:hypothetical protein
VDSSEVLSQNLCRETEETNEKPLPVGLWANRRSQHFLLYGWNAAH